MEISTQAGTTTTNIIGDVPGYDDPVWFHPGGIANIFALSKIIKKYRVTYDIHEGNKFVVHKPDGSTRVFKQSYHGLFYLDTAADDHETALFTTVAQNKTNYTSIAYSCAQAARNL